MTFHIIGAGPAGLSLAYYLSRREETVHVYEKQLIPGGMARSWRWNDFIVDTGPHILHTPLSTIWDDWSDLLGSHLYTQQYYAGNYKYNNSESFIFDYPINTSQLLESAFWSAGQRELLAQELDEYPDSSLCSKASSFYDYMIGLVGPTIASEFFSVYPEKVWGVPATQLLSDWAPKRIRRTSKTESFFGDQFCGVSARGTGYLFESIVEYITRRNSSVFFGHNLVGVGTSDDMISSLCFDNGNEITINSDDTVISTIPISILSRLLGYQCDLSFRGIASVYLSYEGTGRILPDPYSWIYFSSRNISFNRITEPTKLCKKLNLSSKSERTYLIAETTFSTDSYGDVVTYEEILSRSYTDLKHLPLFAQYGSPDHTEINVEPFVYPLQTHRNRVELKKVNSYLSSYSNLELLGTGANYAYNDIQVIFCQANEMAGDLLCPDAETNLSRNYFISNIVEKGQEVRNSSDCQRPLIIAEVGINHNGDSKLLHELIRESAIAADIIKLQLFNASTRIGSFVRELNHVETAQDLDENILQLLDRCAISRDELSESVTLIRSLGRIPMCTAFDLRTLEFVVETGIECIKIASMDLNNYHMHTFLLSCSRTLKLYISTGMSTYAEVETVASMYRESHHDVTFLYCNSSYPTPIESVNIKSIETLRQLGYKVGYSDHTIGISAALASAAVGVSAIEVHFTLDRNLPGPDQLVSKTPSELRQLKDLTQDIEAAVGTNNFGVIAEEYETWRSQKKTLYAMQAIKPGEYISTSNTISISPPLGLSPLVLSSGKPIVATQHISSGSPITIHNCCSND